MKNGLKEIVGKQIAGVVIASSDRAPRQQVFLVFTDGSRFELHGDAFSCCAGLDDADGIADYVRSGRGRIERVFGDPEAWQRRAPRVLATGGEGAPYQVPAPESLQSRMERDLKAWKEAKAVIVRARNPQR